MTGWSNKKNDMDKLSKLSRNDFLTLRKTFKSDAKLAEKLSCTRQYIARLRKKFGIPNTRSNIQERNEEILMSYKSMDSGIDIAKKFRLSISQIYKIIRDAKKMKKN